MTEEELSNKEDSESQTFTKLLTQKDPTKVVQFLNRLTGRVSLWNVVNSDYIYQSAKSEETIPVLLNWFDFPGIPDYLKTQLAMDTRYLECTKIILANLQQVHPDVPIDVSSVQQISNILTTLKENFLAPFEQAYGKDLGMRPTDFATWYDAHNKRGAIVKDWIKHPEIFTAFLATPLTEFVKNAPDRILKLFAILHLLLGKDRGMPSFRFEISAKKTNYTNQLNSYFESVLKQTMARSRSGSKGRHEDRVWIIRVPFEEPKMCPTYYFVMMLMVKGENPEIPQYTGQTIVICQRFQLHGSDPLHTPFFEELDHLLMLKI